jgi:hypothetical protein
VKKIFFLLNMLLVLEVVDAMQNPPQGDEDLNAAQYSNDCRVFCGVFTEDPSLIGARLVRPVTPFVERVWWGALSSEDSQD